MRPLPVRRSIRLSDHDYQLDRWYHVTICARHRGGLFGDLRAGHVFLSVVGRIVEDAWVTLPTRMANVELANHVVMPDHFHGIIRIQPSRRERPADSPLSRSFGGSQAGNLSLAINLFKGDVTRAVRKQLGNPDLRVWHRGYHERLIRTQAQMAATQAYIRNNPRRG